MQTIDEIIPLLQDLPLQKLEEEDFGQKVAVQIEGQSESDVQNILSVLRNNVFQKLNPSYHQENGRSYIVVESERTVTWISIATVLLIFQCHVIVEKSRKELLRQLKRIAEDQNGKKKIL